MRSRPLWLGLGLLAALGLSAAPAGASSRGQSGLSVVSVRVTSPPGQRNGGILSPARLNVIFSTTTVSLTVTLHNTDSQAAQRVVVVLSLARGASASPIVRRETLADVGAGQSAQLRFAALGKVPLVTQTRLTLTLSGHAHPYAIVFTPPD